MRTVPVRGAPVFAAMASRMLPLPDPFRPSVMAIHDASPDAVHVHPGGAAIATVKFSPSRDTLCVV